MKLDVDIVIKYQKMIKDSNYFMMQAIKEAKKAFEDPCAPGNPREVTIEDLKNLYKAAM